ncbi:MAG: hypothetical protein LBE30_05800 [Comamonas sp.]|jgi:predicted phage tail protein|nr:hypothetical protein [Comamonas sp.]
MNALETTQPRSVRGGWSLRGYKGKGGGGSRQPVEASDSLHSTSYARVLDLLSEGEIAGLVNGLQSIYLNNTPLANPDGSLNFEGVTADFRAGTQLQDPIPGFPSAESPTSVGVELKATAPWVRAINNRNLSAVRITLGVNGLSKANTANGDINGHTVEYAIDLQTGGGAWVEVLSTAFTGKTTQQYRRTHRIDLPTATNWMLRVRRLTPNANSNTVADTTVIESITEVIDAKLRYPMSALVGLQVDASQFQGSVPTRGYHIRGRIIRVPSNYNPETRIYAGIWDGTFKSAYSNNPAWVFYDLATNDRYGLGKHIPANWINKWSLYQIGAYCDELIADGRGGKEPRFTCNVYLQTRGDATRVLQDLCSIFRGMVYWAAGAAVPVADMPRDPAYTYSQGKVLDGRFAYSGSRLKDRHTVALVSYNDMTDFGRQKVVYVQDDEAVARYGIRQVEISAFGCTSEAQAHRVGEWALLTAQHETRSVSFSVGLEGTLCAPGQIIEVADSSMAGRRMGGLLKSATATAVVLDAIVSAKAGDTLTVILPNGVAQSRHIAMVYMTDGAQHVTVSPAFDAMPVPESNWSISSTDLAAQLFTVMSVTEGEGLTFDVTAVQHEPGKFARIDHGMALPERPVSVVPAQVLPTPTGISVAAHSVTAVDGAISTTVTANWTATSEASYYEMEWSRSQSDWVRMPRSAATSVDIPNAYTGEYIVRVRAISAIDTVSAWGYSQPAAVAAKALPPRNYDTFVVAELVNGMRQYSFTYTTQKPPADLAGAEVRYIAGSPANIDWQQMRPLDDGGYYTNSFESSKPEAGLWTFALRARSRSGVLSDGMLIWHVTLVHNMADVTPDLTPPPAPTGLDVSTSLANIHLGWDQPNYIVGHGHKCTRVYAAQITTAQPVPGRDVAEIATEINGPLGSIARALGTSWRLWFVNVTNDGVESADAGPINATVGKIGNTDLGPLIVEAGNLADNAVTAGKIAAAAVDATKFANGIEPVGIVSGGTLPTVKTTSTIVFGGKLYRWSGTAYTAAVPTTDITGQINSAQLADNAVTVAKIAAGAVDAGKIAAGAVGETHLANLAVTAAKVADNAVTVSKIAAGAVDAGKLASNAVTADKIAAAAVDATKFANGIEPVGIVSGATLPTVKTTTTIVFGGKLYRWSGTAYTAAVPTADITGQINSAQLADNAVTVAKIAAGAVGETHLANLAVTAAKVADNAVTVSKIAAGAVDAGKIAAGAVGETHLANLAVTAAKVADSAVTVSKIAAGAVDAGKLASNAVTADKIAVAAVDATKFANGIEPVGIVSGATLPTVKTTTTIVFGGKLYRWSGTAYTAATAAADVTGQLTDAQLAAISAAKLTGQITGTQITDGAISTPKIAAGAVSASQIAAGAVTAGKIAANAVTATEIAAGAITAGKIAANAVTAGTVAADAVTAGAIAAGAVNAREIAANAITTDKLVVGSATNLLADGDFAYLGTGWNPAVGGSVVYEAVTDGPKAVAANVMRLTSSSTNASVYNKDWQIAQSVGTGTAVRLKFSARKIAGTSGLARIEFVLQGPGKATVYRQPAGSLNLATAAIGVWTDFNGTYVVENGYTTMGVRMQMGVNGAVVEFAEAHMVQMASGELIVDGAITADKIAAKAITAAEIAAGAITATELAANSVTAGKIAANAVTATQIAAGTITAAEIASGAITTVKIAANAVTAAQIAVGTITAAELAAGSVTTAKIAANAVTATQIAAGTITAAEIASGAITTVKIAANAVTAAQIAAGTITAAELAAGSVTTAKLAAGAVTANELAANAVTAGKIAANAITADNLQANSVTTAKIATGAVSANEIAAGAITALKLAITSQDTVNIDPFFEDLSLWSSAGLTRKQIAGSPGPNVIAASTSISFVPTGTKFAIDTSKTYLLETWFMASATSPNRGFAQVRFFDVNGTQVVGADAVAAGWPATNNSGSTGNFYFPGTGMVTATTWTRHTITVGPEGTAKFPGKAAYMTIGAFLNYAGAAPIVESYWGGVRVIEMSRGELIVDGAITAAKIAAKTITAAEIAAGAITATELAANSVTAGKIAANAVTATQIAAGTITAAEIASGAITTVKIAANAVTAAQIAAGTITAAELAAGSVTTAKIAAGAITATEIATNAITAVKIAAGSVTAGKIAANAVTANEIAANSVTTAKIAAGAVRADQIAASAVTASKLVLADFDNLVVNPDFQNNCEGWVPAAGGANASWVQYQGEEGAGVLASKLSGASTEISLEPLGYADANYPYIQVKPGDQLRVSCTVTRKSGDSGGNVGLWTYQRLVDGTRASRACSGTTGNTPLDTPVQVSNVYIVPADCVGIKFRLYYGSNASSVNGSVAITNISVRRMNGAEMIVDGAITAAKVATKAITAAQIAAGTITAAELGANSVTTAQLAAGAVTANEIAANAITAVKIAAGAVTAGKIAANAVTANEIAANSVTTAKIAAGAVNAAQIAAGAITATKMTLTDTTNLYPDADMLDLDFYSSTGGFTLLKASGAGYGWGYLNILGATNITQDVEVLSGWFQVETLRQYVVSMVANVLTANAGTTASAYLEYGSIATNGVVTATRRLSVVEGINSTSANAITTAPLSAPANNEKRARLVFVRGVTTPNTSTARFSAPVIRRAVSAELIVDGAITATKIGANAIAVGTAAIQNGAIVNAMIGNAAVDNAKIANLNVTKLTGGNLAVGSWINSSNYVGGSQGWSINSNGQAEFSGVIVRGTIHSNAGTIGGISINGNGLNSGGYSGYQWPPAGQSGMHIGPNGILLGNANNGRYIEIQSSGNIYAPGFYIENGNATFYGNLSGASGNFSGTLTAQNVVTTGNLQLNAATTVVNVSSQTEVADTGSLWGATDVLGVWAPAADGNSVYTIMFSIDVAMLTVTTADALVVVQADGVTLFSKYLGASPSDRKVISFTAVFSGNGFGRYIRIALIPSPWSWGTPRASYSYGARTLTCIVSKR